MTIQETRWRLDVCPKCKRRVQRYHGSYNCTLHGHTSRPLEIEVIEATARMAEITRREDKVAAMAEAGQRLAVQWGHQPWSDSWARLVAETLHAAADKPQKSPIRSRLLPPETLPR